MRIVEVTGHTLDQNREYSMTSPNTGGLRRWTLTAAAIAGAFLAGALAVGVITTAAAQPDPTTTTADQPPGHGNARDESQSQRSDEQLLTGENADKARAAALAKYPGATIQRVETDSDGAYEAHLVTADGNRVTVELDANFNVTGEEAGPHK